MRTIPVEWKFQFLPVKKRRSDPRTSWLFWCNMFTTSTDSMFLELGKSVLKQTSLQESIQSIGNKQLNAAIKSANQLKIKGYFPSRLFLGSPVIKGRWKFLLSWMRVAVCDWIFHIYQCWGLWVSCGNAILGKPLMRFFPSESEPFSQEYSIWCLPEPAKELQTAPALPQERVSGHSVRASASHPQTYALINEFPAGKEVLYFMSSAYFNLASFSASE